MHDRWNIICNRAANRALAFVLLPRAKWPGMSARNEFFRKAAKVTADEFASAAPPCEYSNIVVVTEADEEMTLSAGKDIST